MRIIRSILVATDLRESSAEVMRAAAALAAVAGAKLHVMHALDVDPSPYIPQSRELSFDDPIRLAEGRLDEQIEETVPSGVEVDSRKVVVYTAHRAILERASTVAADLIVLGPHRKRVVADAFLGGTADRVIRSVRVPCFLVRAPLSLPLRRVVVPFDLSTPGRGALDLALRWNLAFRVSDEGSLSESRLTVLHIVSNQFRLPDYAFDREVIAPELHREVHAAVMRVEGAADLSLREEVVWGDSPTEEIVRFAAEEKTDLVVLATHGYGAIRQALIGGVAVGVTRAAPCPVLLVPPAMWESEADLGADSVAAVPPFSV
jgi:nucleotide-binding universal stress UspA family protein